MVVTEPKTQESAGSTEPSAGVDPNVLRALEETCERIDLQVGETVFTQGQPADCVYFVLSGRLRAVRRDRDGSEYEIGEAGRGKCFGFIALVENERYPITVFAVRDSRLARLSPAAFERLAHDHPKMSLDVLRFLVKVASSALAGGGSASAVHTVTVVAGSPDVPGRELADRLAAALAEHGQTIMVGEETLEPDGSDEQRLGELEQANEFVVYRAGAPQSEWTRTCLRHADRILLFADGASGPEAHAEAIGALKDFHSDSAAKCDLVLLWNGREPSGTLRWLEGGDINRWHHWRSGGADDAARLARWMAGKAVGLVLGGGGARGFCHAGVAKALWEAGIPIDAVAGTSMGAIVAAAIACDWDYPTMLKVARHTFVDSKPLKDPTLPLVSFVSGKRISRLLEETFGDRQIEDLPIPFFCVSCNLNKARATFHQRGAVWRWLRATVAIPGVISPSVYAGDLLVDGGVIDNMPVLPMRRFGVGRVIAGDVSRAEPFAGSLPDTDSLPRPSLVPWIRKRGPKTPGLISILLRSGNISTTAWQRKSGAESDLCLSLPLEGVGMLDWQRLDEVAEMGYELTRKQVVNWRA